MADHVAVVTGGGRGIGAAIARRLGAEGLAVVIADLGAALDGTGTDPEPAQAVAGSIQAATPELSAYLEHAAGARPDDVAPLVAWLCSEAGGRITGQVLGIRGGELTIWSQPRPVARVLAPGAWTGEALGSLTHPALAAQLTPLEGEFDLLGGPPVPLEPQGLG